MKNRTKKIIKTTLKILGICLILFLLLGLISRCVYEKSINNQLSIDEKEYEPLPTNCFISQIEFSPSVDSSVVFNNMVSPISVLVKDTVMQDYSQNNNTIVYHSGYNTGINPYEEISFVCTSKTREFKYRYMCIDNMDDFDVEYLKSQILKIYGVNLDEYDFNTTIRDLQDLIFILEEDTVFPAKITTNTGVEIQIGATYTNNKHILTVSTRYGFNYIE